MIMMMTMIDESGRGLHRNSVQPVGEPVYCCVVASKRAGTMPREVRWGAGGGGYGHGARGDPIVKYIADSRWLPHHSHPEQIG
jgi:hypothetical protein